MLDKLKNIYNGAKFGLFFVVAPVLSVLGYIFYLRSANQGLETELKHQTADELTKELLSKDKEASNDAKEAEDEYNYIRDQFKRNEQLRNGGKDSKSPDDKA